MQVNDLKPTRMDMDVSINNLGPLAWVLDDLRKSLNGSAKALKRFVRDVEVARVSGLVTLDLVELRLARQQLHQAVGALEMVGLPGPVVVLRAMEAAVQNFIEQPGQCSPEAAAEIEHASFALIEYLDGVLANKPVSPVSLFPQYRQVQELAKADRIHPADLWLTEWRWLDPELGSGFEPRNYDVPSRTIFDRAILQLLKGAAPQVAADLKGLSLGFAAHQTERQPAIFWKIAAAYFEALELGLLPSDVYVRRASSRVLLQYASLSKGDTSISDRLAQDLLFFCAQALAHARSASLMPPCPILSAINLTYSLAGFKDVDYETVVFGRFDPTLLAQARMRLVSAKETWSALVAGEATKVNVVAEQFILVTELLIKLHPASEPLAQALNRAVDAVSRSSQPPTIELAMEVATSLLYLEAALDDLDPSDAQLATRMEHLAERLELVKNGGIAQPLESWMEDLYRRVSDKQTMGSVVGELRLLLGELEKSLGTFFRHPNDKIVLAKVPDQLAQMHAVLSVLGLDQAAHAVMQMLNSVEQLLEIEADDEHVRMAGTFEHLGNNVGTLSFLIDMLNYQPALAKKLFVYDEVKRELRLLMGRTGKTPEAAQVDEALGPTFLREVSSLMRDAVTGTPDDALGSKLNALATHAALAGQPVLAQVAHEGSVAVSVHESQAISDALSTLAIAMTLAVGGQVNQVEEADFEEHDLRGIFLQEAREATGHALEAVRRLGLDPGDINQLTSLRRVFHTLKGSSRMVGLHEFAEAAWALEQLLNGWLAEQKPASKDLLQLSGHSLDGLSRWIEDIAISNAGAWEASAFRVSAETMLHGDRLCLPVLPPLSSWAVAETEPLPPPAAVEPIVFEEAFEAESASRPDDAEIDSDFDFSAVGDGSVQTPSMTPSSEVLDADQADMLNIEGIDLDSLSAISQVLDTAQPWPVAVDVADISNAEINAQFLAQIEPLPSPADQATDLDLSELEADAEFVTPMAQPAMASLPADASDWSDRTARLDDEQIKVIGGLRIGIPLYNVYLNEADEWSRRLLAEVSEWAMEHDSPVSDSVISFAHSLAGSSATVGFNSLSEIARALENALQLSQAHHSEALALRCAAVFVRAAEDIRRLLHQFAAGFLKTSDAVLLSELRALALPDVDPEFATASGPANLARGLDVTSLQPQIFDEATPVLQAGEVELPSRLVAEQLVATDFAAVTTAPVMVAAVTGFSALPVMAASRASAPTAGSTSPSANADDRDDEIDAVDAVDAELFPIFDGEATELMPQLGSALRQWSARPDNLGARMEVLRLLHTLKGSARLAGALRLGEMAHRIESEIEFFGSEAAARLDFEPLLSRFDAMQHTLDALRKADAVHESPASFATPASSAAPTRVSQEYAVSAVSEELQELQALLPKQLPDDSRQEVTSVAIKTVDPVIFRANIGEYGVPPPQTMAMQPLRQAATVSIRVHSQLLDRLVNQAGEVMITGSRLEVELGQLRGSLGDMSDNLNRLRQQLRDIEFQAETQMQSRLAQAKEQQAGFDPLEFDRFTRLQELTRMMAESVNDVATVQRTLQRTVEATEDDLVAQARQTRELQRDLLKTRMVEFESIADRLYRVVRLASKETGKQVKLDLLGATIEMDRGMLDRMTPVFEHLLRNCVAHGIESPAFRSAAGKDAAGLITVELRQEGNDVSVEFRDDGAGLDLVRIRQKAINSGLITADQQLDDQQAANLIFMPGLTTAAQVTELSGRGIGLDVVRSEVNAIGGRIETATTMGQGTQFKLVLPLTTAVTQVVMIRSGSLEIGVPANVVETVRRMPAEDLQQAYSTGTLDVSGEAVPFFWSGVLLQVSRQTAEVQGKNASVVVFRSASQRVALHVDEVLGNREVVVKNLGPQLSRLPGLAGVSVLASGVVVLIYNPVALASVYGLQARALSGDRAEPHMPEASGSDRAFVPAVPTAAPQIPLIMVVDDSITVRRVTQRLLQREGYRVVLAADGLQALERLRDERPVVVLSDIEMPRMDGFDLARNIRGDVGLKDLPIVMITSRIAEKHREHAKELGVDHYLGKPYAEEELLSLVRHYCRIEAAT